MASGYCSGYVSNSTASRVNRWALKVQFLTCVLSLPLALACFTASREWRLVRNQGAGRSRAQGTAEHWPAVDLEAGALAVRVAQHRVGGRLQIDEHKTDRSRRSILLPGVALAAIKAHRTCQIEKRLQVGELWKEHDLVFTTATGKPMAEEVVARAFHRALVRAGLPDMRFYDLRHICASLLLAQGVHMRVVMEILGYSQIAMTMNTYSHVTAQLERHAADQMDALFMRGG